MEPLVGASWLQSRGSDRSGESRSRNCRRRCDHRIGGQPVPQTDQASPNWNAPEAGSGAPTSRDSRRAPLAVSSCQAGVRAGLIARKPAQKATGEAWMASVGLVDPAQLLRSRMHMHQASAPARECRAACRRMRASPTAAAHEEKQIGLPDPAPRASGWGRCRHRRHSSGDRCEKGLRGGRR